MTRVMAMPHSPMHFVNGENVDRLSAGMTEHPSYQQVCSGATGYNEVVRIMLDPKRISYQALLEVFWQ
jgi:peptide methionine sulfoxide reductase MsrA